MAWQLLYTSAPRLLDAGRTGFGTVARHRAVTGLLASSVERFSQFARLAGHDPKRVVYCHRVVIVGANKYHVLSCLRDAGSDYTGRTNHLAHHLIAEAREIAPLMAAGVTPVDVLQGMDWRTEWTEGARFLEPAEEIQLSLIRPQRPRAWKELTGAQEYARLPSGPEAQRAGCYLIAPPTVNILDLLGEALTEVSDQAWSTTFTTTLEPNDEVGDFRWIVLPANSPLRAVTEGSPRIVFDLTAPANLPAPPPRRVMAAPKIPKLPTPVPSDPLRPGASSRPEGPVSLPAPILAPVELPMHGRLRAAVPAGATLAGKKAILWSVTAVAVIFLFLLVYNLGRNQGVSVSTTSNLDEGGATTVAPFNEQDKAILNEINIRKLPTDQAKRKKLITDWEEWRKSLDGIDQISKEQYSESSGINDDLGLFDAEAKAWDNLKRVDTDAKRAEAIRTKIEDSFYDRQKSAIELCKNAKEATDEDEELWLRIFLYHKEKKELFSESKSYDSFGEALGEWIKFKGNEKELVDKNLEKKTNTPEWLKEKIAGLKDPTAGQAIYEPLMGPNVTTYKWDNGQHDVYILVIDTDTDTKTGREGSLEYALESVKYKLSKNLSENIMIVGPLQIGDEKNWSKSLIVKEKEGKEKGYGKNQNSTDEEIIKVNNSLIKSIPRKFLYENLDSIDESIIYEKDGLRIRMMSDGNPCEILIVPTPLPEEVNTNGIFKILLVDQLKLTLTEAPNSNPENGGIYDVDMITDVTLKRLINDEIKMRPNFSSFELFKANVEPITISKKEGRYQVLIKKNQELLRYKKELELAEEKIETINKEISDPKLMKVSDPDKSNLEYYVKRIEQCNDDLTRAITNKNDKDEKRARDNIAKFRDDIEGVRQKQLKNPVDKKLQISKNIENAHKAWESSLITDGIYQLRVKVGNKEILLGEVTVKVEKAK